MKETAQQVKSVDFKDRKGIEIKSAKSQGIKISKLKQIEIHMSESKNKKSWCDECLKWFWGL